jgi:predicted permease
LAFTSPHAKPNNEQTGGTADFVRPHSDEFLSMAVMDDNGPAVNLSLDGGHAAQITSLRVSEGYFRTLGVLPALGRGFTVDEDRIGGSRVAVLSDGLWTRVFGRDPSIVGRAIRVNQETFTVVGVMPSGFAASTQTLPGQFGAPDLFTPLQLGPKDPGYEGDNYEMIARLKPGVNVAQVQQQLTALEKPFYEQNPTYKLWYARNNVLHEFRVWPLQEVMVSDVRRSLLTVMGAVLAVLLVACLNLAGLMLARAMRRSREMALRSALGATRAQLVRLMASEGLVLALGGGALGIVVARVAMYVLLHGAPLAIPTLTGEPSTWLISAVVLALSLSATTVFALLPAWMMLRRRDREMRLGGPSVGETISHARLSRLLLIAQVALAMVLLSTASVLMGTFLKLRALPSGVDPKQLSVFQVSLKGDRYGKTEQTNRFVTAVLNELRREPGVDRVAAINGLPLDRGLNIGGNPSDRHELRQIVEVRTVTPAYFGTMGMPLLAGRAIMESDRAGSDPVIVIGATAAKKWWPGRSPIGETIHLGNEQHWRIVGVVADAQMHSLVESQGVVIYCPIAQLSDAFTTIINGWFPTTIAVRTAADVNIAEIAQKAVEHADPEIPIARLTTMQAVINTTIQEPRFFSYLATSLSAFALALTVIGVFGLLSYQVAQRTREIGVRMALGADRFDILRTFVMRGVLIASVGVGFGVSATWMVRPVIQHLLADAGVMDPDMPNNIVMNSLAAALLAAVAIFVSTLAASWLPARRAASIEPMQALRTE